MDEFCPLGPVIVTRDELTNPQNLDIWCKVNGIYKQVSHFSFHAANITLTTAISTLLGQSSPVTQYRINLIFFQRSNTRKMIFNIRQIISWVSSLFTLVPGDLILTGTPVGAGGFRDPQEFLKTGDLVESGIRGVGIIRNKITQETTKD